MKILSNLFLLLITTVGFGQIDNPNFDAELAGQLGADDYGMKSYTLVILKTGSNTTSTPEFRDSCFVGHMENIHRLVEEKKLIIAGPLMKNDNSYRGIFIFNVATIEEVRRMLETDPAIHSKILAVDIYGWYGSAALSEYLETSDKIWKKKP